VLRACIGSGGEVEAGDEPVCVASLPRSPAPLFHSQLRHLSARRLCHRVTRWSLARAPVIVTFPVVGYPMRASARLKKKNDPLISRVEFRFDDPLTIAFLQQIV